MVGRSLIQEGAAFPVEVQGGLGPLAGVSGAPAVQGYVLTAPRQGLAQTALTVAGTEGADPLYAWWNYGLGKCVAYTSDAAGRWGGAWLAWPQFGSFWGQTVRWAMRPALPANISLSATLDGEGVVVDLESFARDGGQGTAALVTSAVVVGPESRPMPLTLRQIAAGRYQGQFTAHAPGAYLVNVAYAQGAGADAPRGDEASGTLRACPTSRVPRA